MKNTKKLVSLLSVGMILLSTCTACSKQEVVTDEPEASEVEIIDPMFVYPENCTLDENAEKELAKEVRQAKKDGLIDQFIYGSISATYLADIVDSL